MDEGKSRAEIYRQRAINIRQTAEIATDVATRKELLRLAESWERLADLKSPLPPSWVARDDSKH